MESNDADINAIPGQSGIEETLNSRVYDSSITDEVTSTVSNSVLGFVDGQTSRIEESVINNESDQKKDRDNNVMTCTLSQQVVDTEGSMENLVAKHEYCDIKSIRSSNTCKMLGKYFFYDPPLAEETGVWIPVSVPPMSESEHEEWSRVFLWLEGSFLMKKTWDARVKVNLFASGNDNSTVSRNQIDQAWKEMAQALIEANFGNVQQILETEPPKWLPDSCASTCMLCTHGFTPSCVPDITVVSVEESFAPYLMDQVSRASQLPTHDLTDLSTLRSWLNIPWGQSMEHEIYKATNTIQGYSKVGSLRPEKPIPDAILRHAKGLAILTVVKVGMMVTYKIGTGLVIARREDGSWSPPSAISSIGIGWGAQGGGEFADLIIVLRSEEAVKTFSSDIHVSIGAGLSAALGIIGRTAEADVRAGTGGYAACYTYSRTKGAFIGCSVDGCIITTRTHENARFYGKQSISAQEILLGSLPKPPAAATLYRALADTYQNLGITL
ncbi:hypothetical protein E3N88_33386 [Mikania micrantha]|uniref:Ysc84 actin-binding domain-containing protein n=1 Tax=Mikania micrantha TaxID=192012 RepID=A0A5N6MB59_9ASTR|nr:hypothetical protein E3N88_33386 [Mikania micrantha]